MVITLPKKIKHTLSTRTTSLSSPGIIADPTRATHGPVIRTSGGSARHKRLVLALEDVHADEVGAVLRGETMAGEEGSEEDELGEHGDYSYV